MGLERLVPLPDEGGEPSRRTTRQPPTPTTEQLHRPEPPEQREPARPSGRSPKPGRRQRPGYPSRQEREERAAAAATARADEIAADPTGYARQVCLELLAFRPRTAQELAVALARKGVPDGAATEVLTRFAEVGIVDDALFASMWVTSRHRGRGLAGRALSQELRRKGVDDELVQEALAELDPEQEAATARDLVQRKLGATRGLPTEARVRRLAGMLARKGYGAGLAFRIVKEELEREGTDPPDLSFDALPALED